MLVIALRKCTATCSMLRRESKTSSSVQSPRRDVTPHHRHTPEVEEEAREKEKKNEEKDSKAGKQSLLFIYRS